MVFWLELFFFFQEKKRYYCTRGTCMDCCLLLWIFSSCLTISTLDILALCTIEIYTTASQGQCRVKGQKAMSSKCCWDNTLCDVTC